MQEQRAGAECGMAECGITAEEFAKRNVLAFNVRFLTVDPSGRP